MAHFDILLNVQHKEYDVCVRRYTAFDITINSEPTQSDIIIRNIEDRHAIYGDELYPNIFRLIVGIQKGTDSDAEIFSTISLITRLFGEYDGELLADLDPLYLYMMEKGGADNALKLSSSNISLSQSFDFELDESQFSLSSLLSLTIRKYMSLDRTYLNLSDHADIVSMPIVRPDLLNISITDEILDDLYSVIALSLTDIQQKLGFTCGNMRFKLYTEPDSNDISLSCNILGVDAVVNLTNIIRETAQLVVNAQFSYDVFVDCSRSSMSLTNPSVTLVTYTFFVSPDASVISLKDNMQKGILLSYDVGIGSTNGIDVGVETYMDADIEGYENIKIFDSDLIMYLDPFTLGELETPV